MSARLRVYRDPYPCRCTGIDQRHHCWWWRCRDCGDSNWQGSWRGALSDALSHARWCRLAV